MSTEIRFVFKQGKVELEGSGFKGQTCDVALGRFLKALGGPVEEQRHKPEYYEAETEQQNEQQAGNW
jgi:hypothetical protein